jgi:hypothetical protein
MLRIRLPQGSKNGADFGWRLEYGGQFCAQEPRDEKRKINAEGEVKQIVV